MEKTKIKLTIDSELGKAGEVVELTRAEADQARHAGIARRLNAGEENEAPRPQKSERRQER